MGVGRREVMKAVAHVSAFGGIVELQKVVFCRFMTSDTRETSHRL